MICNHCSLYIQLSQIQLWGPDVRLLCSQVLCPNSVSCSQPPPCPHRQHVSSSPQLLWNQPLLPRGWSPLVERNFEHPRPDYCKCLILLRWHCPQPLSVGTGRKEHTHTHRGFKLWVYIIRIQNPFFLRFYICISFLLQWNSSNLTYLFGDPINSVYLDFKLSTSVMRLFIKP